ncbi:Rossmann-like domain-containing protein [Desulfatiglans anilini]|uniref:Rossmann-like domain-containing protein n=1 Tax=Desulfatiglans anilini TaxID=90728 RepID=UPI000420264E|nr:DUF364 domain-containing protein [Desulfatiglans anilini]VBB44330.1 conserved hypothetical protein [uncultured Desulfatiglans sp.]
MDDIFQELKRRLLQIDAVHGLLSESFRVTARPLSVEEAVGHPEEQDFPLQKGKESLMQAEFKGALGQAFTDQYGDFQARLEEILEMPLNNNFRRAVFTASLNALMRHLSAAEKTIHCRDQEPRRCADELLRFFETAYPGAKILQVGFQPRMIESLGKRFPMRVLDLDPDNIGTVRFGVPIEGPEAQAEARQWAEVLLVTGTTLVNDTIGGFLAEKPVVFYGTTIAGGAALMGWRRFCAEGH